MLSHVYISFFLSVLYVFFIFIFILFIYLFLLYNTVLVLPYINMNLPWVYISSQSWTPLPPASPYHPSGLSQCTNLKHPVSCIKPRLAIHFLYDIIHVSMPFSKIIPPSPSPTESKRLFYTSVSLLLSRVYPRIFFISLLSLSLTSLLFLFLLLLFGLNNKNIFFSEL